MSAAAVLADVAAVRRVRAGADRRGITKSFPGVLALDDVHFEVRAGEVNALLGENGAGKSTLIKLMAGFYAPDRGEITVDGMPLVADPAAAHRIGVATIHQDAHLVPAMSVAENIMLGRWPTRYGWSRSAGSARARCERWRRVAPHLNPSTPAGRLSPADRQLVEIARAISEDSKRAGHGRADDLALAARDRPPVRGGRTN